eukprot:6212179-Pleurochrysis_carterae.AAC.3
MAALGWRVPASRTALTGRRPFCAFYQESGFGVTFPNYIVDVQVALQPSDPKKRHAYGYFSVANCVHDQGVCCSRNMLNFAFACVRPASCRRMPRGSTPKLFSKQPQSPRSWPPRIVSRRV